MKGLTFRLGSGVRPENRTNSIRNEVFSTFYYISFRAFPVLSTTSFSKSHFLLNYIKGLKNKKFASCLVVIVLLTLFHPGKLYAQASVVAGSSSNSKTDYAVGRGGNRIITVSIADELLNAVGTVSSITWGGQSLTFGFGNTGGSGANDLRTEIWYLNEAGILAAGSFCNTFIVTWSSGPTDEIFNAVTLTNVDQTFPIISASGATAPNVGTISATLGLLAVGTSDIVLYAASSRNPGVTHTVSTGYSLIADIGGASSKLAVASKKITIAGTEGPTSTWSAITFNQIIGVVINGLGIDNSSPVAFYSLASGNWEDNTSWSASSDGSAGAISSGFYPLRTDNVIIQSGHTITINEIDDNGVCGVSPDGLGLSNVGPFTSSNIQMFYHTGDILIEGTLSVTTIEAMFAGYTHILSTGTLTLNSNLVQLGFLEADLSATLSSLDDLVLTGNSITIINTNSTNTDDLVIDHTDATLCGTGVNTLQNGAGSQITYTNSATVNQICSSFTIACTGAGCSGFPVVGGGNFSSGNSGPGGIEHTDGTGVLGLWLDANTINQTTGTSVSTWSDQSGYGNDAIAPGGNEPVFNTGQLNGFPAVAFTAANSDYLAVTDDVSLDGSTISVFAVGNTTSSSDAFGGFVSKIDDTPPSQGYFLTRDNLNQAARFLIDVGGNSSIGAITYGTYDIMAGIYDQTNVELFLNETSQGQDPYAVAITASGDDLLIGATDPSPVARFLDGDIAESIVFSADASVAQRIIIDNYLSAKYDIALGANDVYAMDNVGNGDYDYEVAGIGQAADGSNHLDAQGTGVARMWNPDDLDNSEFLMWGHDNTSLTSSNTVDVGAPIQERLSRIWRVGESGDVGDVSISFDFSGVGGSPIGSNLRLLIDRDGDGFADNDVRPTVGSVAGGIAVFSNVNFQDGDRITLGNIDVSAPLPIELMLFEAKPSASVVLIQWTTASELNNDFFTVQRSLDAEAWESIATQSGRGTSSKKHTYQAMDAQPYQGDSYYRLKQTDFDGQFAYSHIVSVNYEGQKGLQLSPNPSTGLYTITGVNLESTQIRLYNSLGQPVQVTIVDSGENTTLDIASFPSGIYILQVSDGTSLRSIRLVKK